MDCDVNTVVLRIGMKRPLVGKRASGRRQFLKAARIGDLRAAAFWAASFVPGLSRRVWMNGWRPETVRREAGTEAWSLPDR